MKKIMSVVLALIMMTVFAGCSDNVASKDADVNETTTKETKTADTGNIDDSENEWVNDNNFTVGTADMKFSLFYIPTPDAVCTERGGGRVAAQNDDTLIAFGGQEFLDTYTIENVEAAFPLYFEKVQLLLNDYFNASYDNACTFEIAEQKTMTVNEYEMCRYSGSMVYNDREDDVESNYVAYAVKLKNIDCYAYWFVMDISDDLSAGDAVAYNADYISEHIHE